MICWLRNHIIRIAFAVICAGGTAHADVDPSVQAKADVFFEKAQAHYQAGEYQAAIELFKDAYELVHDPVYLFNVAQSYRKVLDCENAFDYYNQYLAHAPTAENKLKVEQWLRELEPCVEQRKTEHAGALRAQELERQRNEDEARRRREAATPKLVEVDRGQPYRITGVVAGAVGIVGLGVAVGFSFHGASLKKQVADDCATSCDWDAEASKDAAGQRANTLAAVGYIGGGIAAIAGTALYFYGRARIEQIAVVPTSGGATVSAAIRF